MKPQGLSEYPNHEPMEPANNGYLGRTVDDLTFDEDRIDRSYQYRWLRDRITAIARELADIPRQERCADDHVAEMLLRRAADRADDAARRFGDE